MQPDHAGLETDPGHDAPEVVPISRPWAALDRQSSHDKPEHHAPLSDTTAERRDFKYYEQTPPYAAELDRQNDEPKRKDRICGLPRVVFFMVLAVCILVVVLAVVLGAVLGTRSHKHTNSDTAPDSSAGGNPNSSAPTGPPSIGPTSGFAVMYPSGSTTLHAYYQDTQGRIIENQKTGTEWSVQGDDVPQSAIVATDAQTGSPLAAISWIQLGTTMRQVFYIDGNDRLMATNATDDNDWSPPSSILTDETAAPGTNALTATVDTQSLNEGLDGIRVYYGSEWGDVRIVGMNFWENTGTTIWHMWGFWEGSDVSSGVSSALLDSVDHVYMRNITTGLMQLWVWDYHDEYANGGGGWTSSTTGPQIPPGSDIAAATDGETTNYIFYQDANGRVVRALDYGKGIGNYLNLKDAAQRSKLQATYDSSGSSPAALVVYRAEGSPVTVAYSLSDRSGATIESETIG